MSSGFVAEPLAKHEKHRSNDGSRETLHAGATGSRPPNQRV